MKGNTKLIVLVVVFAILLGALWAVRQGSEKRETDIRTAQTTPFFPGLTADQVFRIEISSLQDSSLLFRKEAGVWEVALGRDIMSELMQQTPENQEVTDSEDEAAAPEEKFGLSENQRKTIFRELLAAEDRATAEAVMLYPTDVSNPNWRENVEPQSAADAELAEKYKAEVREQHGITEEIEIQIVLEGIAENWPDEDHPVDEEEESEPYDPRRDTGPSGDAYRTFYRADPDRIEPMIDAIIDLRHGQLVTTDPDKHTDFGVSNNIVGMEVIFYDQGMNKLAEIIVGNQGRSFTSNYVRLPDEDEIYEVATQLKMTFAVSLETIRDRTIFRAAPETITAVAIRDHEGGNQLDLRRSEGIWLGTDSEGNPFELDAAKVDDLLSALGTLSANSFPDRSRPRMPPPHDEEWDESDPWGILHPNVEVEFTTADNVTHKLSVGRAEGTTYYAVVESNPDDIFRLSESVVHSLRPAPESLQPGAEDDQTADAATIPADRITSGTLDLIPIDELPGEVAEAAGE